MLSIKQISESKKKRLNLCHINKTLRIMYNFKQKTYNTTSYKFFLTSALLIHLLRI